MDSRKVAEKVYMVLLLLSVFVLGFFVGRNQRTPEITVSQLPVSEVVVSVPESQDQDLQGPVNLNTADRSALETLPGIGPGLAERILEYRDQVGRFVSVEQIMDVEGIGEKRFEEIRDRITVEVHVP